MDYVTPLCTQQTYTGILDDWFNTECGKGQLVKFFKWYLKTFLVLVTFPGDVGIHDDKAKAFQHVLNSDDRIFTLIRDKQISSCVMELHEKGKQLKKVEDTNLDSLNPEAMKDFVKNLPQHKADERNLHIHMSGREYIFKRLAEIKKTANLPDRVGGEPILMRKLSIEEILLDGSDIGVAIAFIQECIARRCKMSISLRLLCLLSTTYSGIPTKVFNDLKVGKICILF